MRVSLHDKPTHLVNIKKGDKIVHKYSGVPLGTVYSVGNSQIRYYDAKGKFWHCTAPETSVIREGNNGQHSNNT